LSSLHDGEEGRNLLQPDQLLVASHLLGQPEVIHRDESVVGGAGEPGFGPGGCPAAQPRGREAGGGGERLALRRVTDGLVHCVGDEGRIAVAAHAALSGKTK
jgi:hypothetical protein